MRSIALCIVVALTWLIGGCSGGGGSSDTNGTPPDIDAPVTNAEPEMPPLYAVQIEREADGDILVDKVEYLPAQTGIYRPLGALAGDYVALAYAGQDIVDAIPVDFYDTYIAEQFIGDGLEMSGTVNDTPPDATVRFFIDATEPVDRIDIVDSSQTVLASITELPVEIAASGRSRRAFAGYPWIELLDETDSHPIIDELSPGSGTISLSPAEIAELESALDALPRRLVSAISTLGFASLSRPGVAYGGHIFLDILALTFERGRQVYLLAHEAGHAYHSVSLNVAGETYTEWASNWPGSIISAVSETHRQFGLDKDVGAFWAELHQSAVEADIAANYRGADSAPFPGGARLNGFVTDYASERLSDDFAESVAIANFKTIQDLAPAFSSSTCLSYQLADELSKLTSLAYIKLRLVQQMGLAEDGDVEWCVGDVAPTQSPGIKLGNAIFFGQELKAGYTGNDRQQFNIVGQDAEGRGLAIELATEGRLPIGVYPLDLTWWGSWDGSNTLVIASPNDFEARTASSGVVVITYASSSERVDGFVFNLNLRSALGPASSFDFVPFRIPL